MGQNLLPPALPSSVVGKHSSCKGGPEGWGPEGWGPEGWGPEGWGAQNFALFFLTLPPPFFFFLLSWGSWTLVVLKRQVPEMCTFGVLGLSCEAPARKKRLPRNARPRSVSRCRLRSTRKLDSFGRRLLVQFPSSSGSKVDICSHPSCFCSMTGCCLLSTRCGCFWTLSLTDTFRWLSRRRGAGSGLGRDDFRFL